MGSCAKWVLAAALAARPALAQDRALPEGLEASVASAVAPTLGVSADRVALAWGTIRQTKAFDDSTEFRIHGGKRGWFAVVFEPDGAPSVAARLRAGVHVEVPVAARPLLSGQLLSAADVRYEKRVRWGVARHDTEANPQPGWIVRRPVGAGEELRAGAAAPPPVIAAGARVRLVVRRGNVRVEIGGVALSEAAPGDRVTVRVDRRHGHARGVALSDGSVLLES